MTRVPIPLLALIAGCSQPAPPSKQASPSGSPPAAASPAFTTAKLDPTNVENTRAWAEKAVARLKEIDAKGNRAATDAEVDRLKKELKAGLEGKTIRWSLPINGVRKDGEVDLEQFFGHPAGKVIEGEDAGKPLRKLYFRIYLEAEADAVRVGNEITNLQAVKGASFPLQRQVIDTDIRQRDSWSMRDRYTGIVDVLDTFCVDVIVQRK